MKTIDASILPRPRPRRWQAKWIWTATPHDGAANAYVYFRKIFDLETAPAGCKLFVSADRFYQLFINGKLIGRGPPPSQPWFHYYDEYDVSSSLRQGRNCIAAVVHHIAEQPYGDPDGRARGGLLLEVTDARGAAMLITDAAWHALPADAWMKNTFHYGNVVAPYVECFDARRAPAGWHETAYDQSDWPAAVIICSKRRSGAGADAPPAAGPWTKLVPREIPFMSGARLRPERVVTTEESVDLNLATTNLAPGLSMTGKPVQYTRCENADALCRAGGVAVFQGSLEHLNLDCGSLYSPAVVLDFGRIVTAHVRLELDGPAGGIIDIGYAECLIDGHFNIAVDGAGIADRYVMKDGPQTFETFTWKAFRFLKLRFRACPRPVSLHGVQALVSTYPYEERGLFKSDDATLDRIFEISKSTLRLCSNDFMMDTPWREKAQWLGDNALVTLPAIHACFGDSALPRKFLLQAGQNQFPTGLLANVSNCNSMARWRTWTKAIPDYSLWWIGALRDQYLYTGDLDLLHRLYPQALRVLDTHLDYLNERMLIENMPYWVFLDWADIEKSGIGTVYNAIFYRTLECLHQLAGYKDDRYTAALTGNLRAAMHASFAEALFDKQRGCFADACIDGQLSERISEHGNMTPVWAGLCDDDQARTLAGMVFDGGAQSTLKFTEAQPFYMAVVLPALARAGRFDLALRLIRERWGRRMLDAGATATFECWQEHGRWTSGEFKGILNSHSHAWSACPADFLIRHLLGLTILEPGCRRIRLAPQNAGFNYRITFPTPLGDITAECRGGQPKLDVPGTIDVQPAGDN